MDGNVHPILSPLRAAKAMVTKKQKEKGMEAYLRAFRLAGMCNVCIAALRSNKVFCDPNLVRHPTCVEIVEDFADFVIDDLAKKQTRKETKGKVLEFKRRAK